MSANEHRENDLRDVAHALARRGCNPIEPLGPQVSSVVSELADAEHRLDIYYEAIYMAMGCISPLSKNRDERLAWHRLNGALRNELPRPSLEEYEQ